MTHATCVAMSISWVAILSFPWIGALLCRTGCPRPPIGVKALRYASMPGTTHVIPDPPRASAAAQNDVNTRDGIDLECCGIW